MKKIFYALCFLALSGCHPVMAEMFSIDGPCEAKFSPHGGITNMLVRYIGQAERSIDVLAYSFTSKPIADALIAAHARGVSVRVILDKSQETAVGTQRDELVAAGVPTWIDYKHAIQHNKILIIDGKWVENGSFNYTVSAENSNGENAKICPSVSGAALYSQDFEKHLRHSDVAKK
jgi:phosphatidylserine/phosphatidylglycerophosphate/cardiolipin synthase-like enzyme